MLRFAVDENFHGNIVRGVLRRRPEIDIVRVQDTPQAGTDDPDVLEWAASEGRVLLTHDVITLIGDATTRVRSGRDMPGVMVVPRGTSVAAGIEAILLVAECSREGEWEGQVVFLLL